MPAEKNKAKEAMKIARMRPRELTQAIQARVSHPELPPLLIWGGAGTGKSSITKQVAMDSKPPLGYIDLRLVLLDPTDLRGIPFLQTVEGRNTAVWAFPSYLPMSGNGILHLDELNLAPLLTQHSAYQLILDRKIGEYTLPGPTKDGCGWIIISCANKREHGASVKDIDAPLRNRFQQVELEVGIEDWTNWAVKNNVHPDVVGFLNFKPSLLDAYDAHRQEDAFPSPRSWEFVSKVIRADLRGISAQSIAGLIGDGAAVEFGAFQKLKNELPDIDSILDGKVTTVPEKLDLKYVLVGALAEKAKPKHYERLFKYGDKLDVEFSVLLIKLLAGRDRIGVTTCSEWSGWVEKHREVFLQ